MENSFESLRGMVADSLQHAPLPASMEIEARAMRAIEEEEDFDDVNIARPARVIAQNPSTANLYLNMSNKKARTLYLIEMMGGLK